MKRNPAARSRTARLFPASTPPAAPVSLPPTVPPSHLATGLAALFGAATLTAIALILSALL